MIKRTTLKDIAEKLDVSVATVSRALKNHPDISQKIKDQVNLMAEALHYRPNSFAVHLRKQRSGTIGLIVPKLVHHYFSTVISSITKTAHESSYQVMICESNNSYEQEKEDLFSLLSAGVDGFMVAISNNTFKEDHFKEIQNEGIPIVFFDKIPDTINAHKISTNDFSGAFKATEHLIAQGYNKIAHLKGQIGSRNALPRYQGYCSALKKYGLNYIPNLIPENSLCTEQEGYNQTIRLMQSANPPDAIFAVNDEMAIGAMAALRDLNISIPGEVGIVGFSNSNIAGYLNPALTSVSQLGGEMGAFATKLLLSLIDEKHRKEDPKTFTEKIFEPELIIRGSSLKTNSKEK